MAVKLGKIKFYVGPKDVAPSGSKNKVDDIENVIVDFLDGAKKQLLIAVQEIDSMPIARAIVRASKRGVKVRVVSEADYLTVPTPAADPFKYVAGVENEVNRQIQLALLRATTWVRTDFNPAIFHQKFVIRDRKAVLTGSANFTDTDTHQNLNHVVVIDDETVAGEYLIEFREIESGSFGGRSVAHSKEPREVVISGVRVKPCFSPDHGPEMEIMKQMLKAKSRVDFAIFTFSGSSGIDDTMLTKHSSVAIRGVMDRTQGGAAWAPTNDLVAAGMEIYKCGGNQKGIRKLHHKMMVIDDSVTIVGSFNYTAPANLYNDENIIILGDIENPTPQQKKIAVAARKEIDRIVAEHSTRVNLAPPA